MRLNEIIFLFLTICVIAIGTQYAVRSQKVRDYLLFGLVLGTTCIDRVNCNYFGRDWYRGTARGLQIAFIDWIVFILFFAMQTLANQQKKTDNPGDKSGATPPTAPWKWFWPAGYLPMAVYAGYCLLAVLMQDPLLFGIWELGKILRGLFMYYVIANYVRGEREVRLIINGVCAAMLYEGYMALFERYKGGIDRVPGTFDHANSLSIYSITAGLLLLTVAFSSEKKPRSLIYSFAALLSIIAVLLTQSRTGFVTIIGGSLLIMGACGLFKPTLRNFGILLAILSIGGIIIGRSWKTIKNRMADNSSELSKDKTEGRQYYFNLAKLMLADKPLGVGLNLWSWYATNIYGGRMGMEYNRYRNTVDKPDPEIPYGSQDLAQAAPGHSIVALTLGELGYPGAFIFAIVWLRWFMITGSGLRRRNDNSLLARAHMGTFFGLLGCFNQSQTEWAFRQPAPFFFVHIMLGMSAAILHMREEEKPGLIDTDVPPRNKSVRPITPRRLRNTTNEPTKAIEEKTNQTADNVPTPIEDTPAS